MARVLVWDTGYFLGTALTLARLGHEVYYYIDWVDAHPRLEDWVTGWGFEGIRKLKDVGGALEKVDYVVFPDVGFGGIADTLRRQGYPVFGASEMGERLELDRAFMHAVMTELGVARPRTLTVKGVDGVRDAVDRLGGGYVKISTWRGNFETFYARDGEEAEAILSEADLGPMASELTFIVEERLEGPEIGCDCIFDGKRFAPAHLFGVEVKDRMNASVVTDLSPFTPVLARLEPWLQEAGYRGAISLEGILLENGDVAVLDVTARLPFPAHGIEERVYANFDELVFTAAEGDAVEPEPVERAGCEIVIATELADKWLPLTVKGEEEWVNLKYAVRIGDRLYHVPSPVVAGAVGLGSDTREAYGRASRVAGMVECNKCVVGEAWEEYESLRALVEAFAPT